MSDLCGQLAKAKLSTVVVVIHENSFECCFTLDKNKEVSVS